MPSSSGIEKFKLELSSSRKNSKRFFRSGIVNDEAESGEKTGVDELKVCGADHAIELTQNVSKVTQATNLTCN